LRTVFAESVEGVINNLSIPILKPTSEFLHEPTVLARIRAVEKESPRLLFILRKQSFYVPRPHIGEFPLFRQSLFNPLSQRRKIENPFPERPAFFLRGLLL